MNRADLVEAEHEALVAARDLITFLREEIRTDRRDRLDPPAAELARALDELDRRYRQDERDQREIVRRQASR